MENPYGAVPEALKETRLSLRDIMADMLMTKKMEQDLSLAKTKAETETAMVSANLERDRLQNLKDIAQMNEVIRANQAHEQNAADTLELHRQGQDWEMNTKWPGELDLKNRELKSLDSYRRGENAIRAGHLNLAREQQRRESQTKTMGEWLQDINISPEMGKVFFGPSLDLNRRLTRADAEATKEQAKNYMRSYPGVFFADSYNRATKAGLGLLTELKNPNLSLADRKKKEEQVDFLLNYSNDIRRTHEMITGRDTENKAIETYGRSDSLQSKYPEVSDYVNDVRKIKDHYLSSPQRLDNAIKKYKLDSAYDDKMSSAASVIEKYATPRQAAAIQAGIQNYEKSGDLKGAMQYTVGWARQLYNSHQEGSNRKQINAMPYAGDPFAEAGLSTVARQRKQKMKTEEKNFLWGTF